MEDALENYTSLKNTDENWGLILDICDKYASTDPKRLLKLLYKKMYHKNPHVCSKSITLFDSCCKNVGKVFMREVASKEFVTNFKSKYPNLHPKPRQMLTEIVKNWSTEYAKNIEIGLLSTLYLWINIEYPEHLSEHKMQTKSVTSAHAKDVERQEEDELAKAIALSLSEAAQTAGNAGSSTSPQRPAELGAAYPRVSGSVVRAQSPVKGICTVRALLDFEAVEENELSFLNGDLICLLDDSDQNWWLGRSHRGQGLFPAQFVERQLGDAVPPALPPPPPPPQPAAAVASINPSSLRRCLNLLTEADPTGVNRADAPELAGLEEKCRAMQGLIDHELELVDARINEVTELNSSLLETLQAYHSTVDRASSISPAGKRFASLQGHHPLFYTSTNQAPNGQPIYDDNLRAYLPASTSMVPPSTYQYPLPYQPVALSAYIPDGAQPSSASYPGQLQAAPSHAYVHIPQESQPPSQLNPGRPPEFIPNERTSEGYFG